jgi:protein phosphatase
MKRIDSSKLDRLIVGKDTHEGETGKNNEDTGDFFAFRVSDEDDTIVHVGIVADGIGGHQAGERASQMGVAIVKECFRAATSLRLVHQLEEAFKTANARIVAEGRKHAELRGMGTTMTAAAIVDNRLYVGHVGDSRAYLIRGGKIYQLTVDHTWAQEAIEAGRLSREQARLHPNRNVIKRYMGIKPDMEVDFRLYRPEDPTTPSPDNQGLQLRPGDVVLLCSDGLSDLVDDEHILEAVETNAPQKAAEKLVKMARAKGGYDNITVVAMQIPRRVGAPTARLFRWVGLVAGGLLALAAIAAGGILLFGDGRGTPDPTMTLAPTIQLPSHTPTIPSSPTPQATLSVVPTTVAPTATPTTAPAVAPTLTATGTAAPTESTVAATPTSVPTRTATNTPFPTFTLRPATATYTSPPPTATATGEAPPPTSQPVPQPTAQPQPTPQPPAPSVTPKR